MYEGDVVIIIAKAEQDNMVAHSSTVVILVLYKFVRRICLLKRMSTSQLAMLGYLTSCDLYASSNK